MLIGAVTVLVVLVAVFLAYNANRAAVRADRAAEGRPADGSNLVVGNDVREGGYRIGIVIRR